MQNKIDKELEFKPNKNGWVYVTKNAGAELIDKVFLHEYYWHALLFFYSLYGLL